MAASITFHDPDFKLAYEMPWNSYAVGIKSKDRDEVTIYFCDADKWISFRSAFGKGDGYFFSPSKEGECIKDHYAADAAAAEFYHSHKQPKAA